MTEIPRFLHVIVVGADGSDGAMGAMQWAARLAATTGASVRVVHVLTYDREFARDLSIDTMTNWRQDLEHQLKTDWVAPLIDHGVSHRCVVVEDESPAAGLIHAADREQSDLIVVGAGGHGSLASRVLGSTSNSLTHQARRPVIVVPATWSRPTAA